MAIEAIKKVTQIEQDAQKRRDAAAAEGKLLVADAQKAGRKLLEEKRQQAEAQARQMMQQAEAEAAQAAEVILADADKECQALKEAARDRLEQAVELIVEKVVNG